MTKPTYESFLDAVIALETGEASFDEAVETYQVLIDTGQAWMLQGSVGRAAMEMIDNGYCTVGTVAHRDYYGNLVPAISMLEPGTKGTPEYVAEMTARRAECS